MTRAWIKPNASHFANPAAQALFERVGLKSVTVRAIDIPTVFQNFDDYWNPFLDKDWSCPDLAGR